MAPTTASGEERDGRLIAAFASAENLDQWLEDHGGASDGIWLKLGKKGSGRASVTYDEAVDLGLAHGWIDGKINRFDDEWYLILFTPRRARSRWSQINVERVARLEAHGRMRPAGRAQVDAAKADGRWAAAYASPSKMTVPDDLAAALDAAGVRAAFDALKGAERYSILYQIHDAKKPETRARRITKHVAALVEGRPGAGGSSGDG